MRSQHRTSLSCALLLCLFGGLAAEAQGPAPSSSPYDRALQAASDRAKNADYAGAVKLLEPFRKDPGAPARVLSLLGALYMQSERPADALAVLRPLADPPTAEPAVLYNAGRAALATGDLQHGELYLARSLQGQPGSPAARELGLFYAHQGKVVQAYRLLRPWVLNNPEDGEPRLMAGMMALRLDRLDEAGEMVAGFKADDPAIRLLRGEISTARGDGTAALVDLEALRAHHPDSMASELHRALAGAYLATGNGKAALQELASVPPKTPAIALLWARAQRISGDPALALVTLRPFVQKLPAEGETVADPRLAAGVALENARSLQAGGRAPEALPFFERATRINPIDRDAWDELAKAYDRAGRSAEAAQARAKLEALKAPQQQPAAH